jgi:hypothetical protein
MAELEDALDLGSSGVHPWGFDSPSSHHAAFPVEVGGTSGSPREEKEESQ